MYSYTVVDENLLVLEDAVMKANAKVSKFPAFVSQTVVIVDVICAARWAL